MNSTKLNRTSVSFVWWTVGNVSEENFAVWGDFVGDESLSTSSQFIGIFMLNLLLFFSKKEKEDWLDDTPIAAFQGCLWIRMICMAIFVNW